MERTEWLKDMRDKAEKLYDLYAPRYWVDIGKYQNETQLEYLQKFLGSIPPHSNLLSAGCGAGRHDGILLDAGHNVVGIDQSEGMLARAREFFQEVQYEKKSLQEMDFMEEFDGIICIEALAHVCPEDWPGIMSGFRKALIPGGLLYFTAELDGPRVVCAYERAKAMGLPLVFGEVVDEVEEAYNRAVVSKGKAKAEDASVYHYCPTVEQVREWIGQAGLIIEEEQTTRDEVYASGYFITRKM